jgi:hypothetical protein
MQFELSYFTNGQHIKLVVAGTFIQARVQAKEIAKAVGSRVVITRKQDHITWSVYVIDSDTRQKSLVWDGLTKQDVLKRWKRWREGEVRAILIAIPSCHGKVAG